MPMTADEYLAGGGTPKRRISADEYLAPAAPPDLTSFRAAFPGLLPQAAPQRPVGGSQSGFWNQVTFHAPPAVQAPYGFDYASEQALPDQSTQFVSDPAQTVQTGKNVLINSVGPGGVLREEFTQDLPAWKYGAEVNAGPEDYQTLQREMNANRDPQFAAMAGGVSGATFGLVRPWEGQYEGTGPFMVGEMGAMALPIGGAYKVANRALQFGRNIEKAGLMGKTLLNAERGLTVGIPLAATRQAGNALHGEDFDAQAMAAEAAAFGAIDAALPGAGQLAGMVKQFVGKGNVAAARRTLEKSLLRYGKDEARSQSARRALQKIEQLQQQAERKVVLEDAAAAFEAERTYNGTPMAAEGLRGNLATQEVEAARLSRVIPDQYPQVQRPALPAPASTVQAGYGENFVYREPRIGEVFPGDRPQLPAPSTVYGEGFQMQQGRLRTATPQRTVRVSPGAQEFRPGEPPAPVVPIAPESPQTMPVAAPGMSEARPGVAAQPVAYSAAGGAAGWEQDEEGNWRYDPVKGAIGLASGLALGVGAMRFQRPAGSTPPKSKLANLNVGRGLGQQADEALARGRAAAAGQMPPMREAHVVDITPVTQEGRIHGINLNNYEAEAQALQRLKGTAQVKGPQLDRMIGEIKLEDIEVAANGAEEFKTVISRGQQLEREAKLLRTRQKAIELASDPRASIKDIYETLRVIRSHASEYARGLGSLRISAGPEFNNVKLEMLRKLEKAGFEWDQIEAAAAQVDWNNTDSVVKFYRAFVNPTRMEYIDAFRYGNMLSAPLTHIVNLSSNLAQVVALRPATYLTSGAIDRVAQVFRPGHQREYYMRMAPAYVRGSLSEVGTGVGKAIDVMRGRQAVTRPDLEHIPTGSKFLKPWEMVSRALDAGDVLFRTIAEGGEREALAYKAARKGQEINPAALEQESKELAEYTVFRSPLDPGTRTGQGKLLAALDVLPSALQGAGQRFAPIRWFVPFVRTPMNIIKQGVEFTPAGYLNIPGNARKQEAVAKALTGSLVTLGAAWMAMEGRTTWAVPSGKKQRAEFYGAGLQPYSVKIGDTWYSYQRIGPLAYPIALAAAWRHYHDQAPSAMTDTQAEKMMKTIMGMSEFFADQSYLQGVGDMLNAVQGDKGGVADAVLSAPGQLIPMSSLIRWTSRVLDPVVRQPERSLSAQGIYERTAAGIPFLSQTVPALMNPDGTEAQRGMNLWNQFSPVRMTESNPMLEAAYWQAQREKGIEELFKR